MLLSINIASISANDVGVSPIPSVSRSVYLCVQKVYYDKTADWTRMLFRMMSWVGQEMGVLDGVGNCRRGRGSFWGEFRVSHCIQWGLCLSLIHISEPTRPY